MIWRLVFIALVTGACVLPPPVDVQQAVNQRPWIDIDATSPPKAGVELNINCQQCTFSLQVDDPDAADTLFYRWFFDYDTGGRGITPISGCDDQIPPPVNGSTRPPLSCVVPLNTFVQQDGTFHTLEVWVSDRAFDSNTATPANRATPQGANVVVREWTVQVNRRGTTCTDVEHLDCKGAQ